MVPAVPVDDLLLLGLKLNNADIAYRSKKPSFKDPVPAPIALADQLDLVNRAIRKKTRRKLLRSKATAMISILIT